MLNSFIVLVIFLLGLAIYLLKQINFDVNYRYLQRTMLLYPLSLFVILLVPVYFKMPYQQGLFVLFKSAVEPSMLSDTIIGDILRLIVSDAMNLTTATIGIVALTALVLLWVMIKLLIVKLFGPFIKLGRRLSFYRRSKKKYYRRNVVSNKQKQSVILWPAYKLDEKEGDIRLRNGMVNLSDFCSFAYTVVSLLIATLLILLARDIPVSIQGDPSGLMFAFLGFLTLLLIELVNYLGGMHSDKLPDDVHAEDVALADEDFQGMRANVLEKWSNRFLTHGLQAQEAKVQEASDGHKYFDGVRSRLEQKGVLPNRSDEKLFLEFATSDNIIVSGIDLQRVSPVLLAHIQRNVSEGGRVLLLADVDFYQSEQLKGTYKDWLKQGLRLIDGESLLSHTGFDWSNLDKSPAILLLTEDTLYEKLDDEVVKRWLSGLSIMVYLYPSQVDPRDSRLSYRYAIAQNISIICNDKVQILALCGSSLNTEKAIRENLKQSHTARMVSFDAGRATTDFIVWRLEYEYDSFQHELLTTGLSSEMGAAMVFALYALSEEKFNSINVHGEIEQPWRQQLTSAIEAVNRGVLDPEYEVPPTVLRDTIKHYDKIGMQPVASHSLINAYDSYFNFPLLLQELRQKSTVNNGINVFSSPYLLRDYFCDNVLYFIKSPMLPLVPIVSEFVTTVAERLLFQLVRCSLDDKHLKQQLSDANIGTVYSVEVALQRLFKQVYNIDIFAENRLIIDFENQSYRLDESILRLNQLDWLSEIQVYVTNEAEKNLLAKITKDHVYQYYLPGQVHTFNGKNYRISDIDLVNNHIILNPVHAEHELLSYRQDALYELSFQGKDRVGQGEINSVRNDVAISISKVQVDMSCYVRGYWDFSLGRYSTYYELSQIVKRDNKNMRGLWFTFDIPKDDNSLIIYVTLATLIYEMLPTLFPQSFKLLQVFALGKEFGQDVKDYCRHKKLSQSGPDTLRQKLPKFRWGVANSQYNDGILIVEDSHADVGLVQSMFLELNQVLAAISDYLTWTLSEKPNSDIVGRSSRTLNENMNEPFLAYGNIDNLTNFDLQGVFGLLGQYLGYASRDASRQRFYTEQAVSTSKGKFVCDICETIDKKSFFDQLEDGRMRCKTCGEGALDTAEQLKAVYKKAKELLESEFAISVPGGIRAEFVNARRMGELSGRPFTPTPAYDGRVLGFAQKEGDSLKLYVENGGPEYFVMSVILHELTHIWQFSKLSKAFMDENLQLIEGHAVWVEMRYLEGKKLAPNYCKRIRKSDDIYGKGLKQMDEMLKQHKQRNAFKFLEENYGILT